MSRPVVKLLLLVSKWATELAIHAQARGHTTMVIDPNGATVPEPITLAQQGWTLFARLDQAYPEEGRAWALRFMSAGGKCVQSVEDLKCYENRAYQMRLLADWYPRGVVLHSKEPAAVTAAIQELGLPIVSKARYGSSSHTVRSLLSRSDVDAEVAQVFGEGIPHRGGKVQYGECLWQAFVHGNTSALRIARVTKDWGWMFRVMNRPHDWRASGSGVCEPIHPSLLRNTPRLKYAIKTFLAMADGALGSNWCAADLLYDHIAGCWLVVDVTLAWNMSNRLLGANWDAVVFNLHTLEDHPKGYRGRDQWDLLLDDLEAGR